MHIQVLILSRTCLAWTSSHILRDVFNHRRAGFLFAIGGELRAISLGETLVNASGKFCFTANMKGQTSKNWRSILVSILWTRLTLENWRAKLLSVVLAIMVWYLIKQNVATTSSLSERPSPTPATETR
jgi:hypothetical protein